MKSNKDNTDYSIPYQIVSDNLTKQNTRWFRAWLITFIALMVTIIASFGYIVYLLNDAGSYDIQNMDISDIEELCNSEIRIGDNYGENNAN